MVPFPTLLKLCAQPIAKKELLLLGSTWLNYVPIQSREKCRGAPKKKIVTNYPRAQ